MGQSGQLNETLCLDKLKRRPEIELRHSVLAQHVWAPNSRVGIKYAGREKEEGQSEQVERSSVYCCCCSPDVMEKLLKL